MLLRLRRLHGLCKEGRRPLSRRSFFLYASGADQASGLHAPGRLRFPAGSSRGGCREPQLPACSSSRAMVRARMFQLMKPPFMMGSPVKGL